MKSISLLLSTTKKAAALKSEQEMLQKMHYIYKAHSSNKYNQNHQVIKALKYVPTKAGCRLAKIFDISLS